MLRNTPAAPRRIRSTSLWASLFTVAAVVFVSGSSGCAATTPARSSAIDRIELVKSATFDHGCPAQDIRVLGEERSPAGAAIFLVDVCGTRRQYTRVGSMYFDTARSGS